MTGGAAVLVSLAVAAVIVLALTRTRGTTRPGWITSRKGELTIRYANPRKRGRHRRRKGR